MTPSLAAVTSWFGGCDRSFEVSMRCTLQRRTKGAWTGELVDAAAWPRPLERDRPSTPAPFGS
jgi:hypothetical protein